MAKSLSSDNVRVPNELLPGVKKLNQLYREGGNVPALVEGLDALIQAVESGQTFGNRVVQNRLAQLEMLVGASSGKAIAPTAAVEQLTMEQLCKRFSIVNASYQADWTHVPVVQWLEQKTGWRHIGSDRFISAG